MEKIIGKAFTKDELANFEAWRGVLATMVVIAHVCQIFFFPLYSNSIFFSIVSGLANIAVLGFFVLSGILISLSIKNLTKENDFNWKQYLINRFFRIYPGLIIVLVICILLRYLLPFFNNGSIEVFHIKNEHNLARANYKISIAEIFRTIFLLQPGIVNVNGPLWSLFIEWWIYISAMFFVLMNKAFSMLIRFALFAGFIISLLLCIKGYGLHALFLVAVWYIGFFYTLFLNKASLRKIYLYSSVVFVILAVVLGGVSIFDINTANKYYFGFLQLAVGLISFILIHNISPYPFFKSIAKYSYTLYIFHFPVLLFIFFISRRYIISNISLNISVSIISFVAVFLLSKLLSEYSERRYSIQTKRPLIKDVKIEVYKSS